VKLSILIPAFNEEDTIQQSIQGVLDTDFLPMTREIIIVDDASTDRTRGIVDGFGDCVHLIRHQRNLGKGAAIRTALEYATGDIIVIHDADLEYDPGDLPALVKPIVGGQSVAAFGSRFMGHARPGGMKAENLIANKILTLTANVLYGGRITDEATCYKAIRRDVLMTLGLRCSRFEFCPEVTAKLMRAGHKIVDVPVRYSARTVAQGKKIHWYDGLEAVWTLVRYRLSR
jgi:dolichol-phosphate mannosyltransferase